MTFSTLGPQYLLKKESNWNPEEVGDLGKDLADGSQRSAEVRVLWETQN